jgi:hypothetical protein
MSDLQILIIIEEAEDTITTKSEANGIAPTTSMYELTGITFELRKGRRELGGACSVLWIFFWSLGNRSSCSSVTAGEIGANDE